MNYSKEEIFPEELVSSVAKKGSVNQCLQQVRSCVLAAIVGRCLGTV